MRRLVFGLLFILIISMLTIPEIGNADTTVIDPIRSTEWTTSTMGPIYGYKYDFLAESFEFQYFGHADGQGNIYINEYHVAPNETLYINEGVNVFITNPEGDIAVFGDIYIEGSSSNPVSILHNETSTDSNSVNFRIEKSSNVISIDNCIFNSLYGFIINNPIDASICIRNCSFEKISFLGTGEKSIQTNYDLIFLDNTISDGGLITITVEKANIITFNRNIFEYRGVMWLTGNEIEFKNNIIEKAQEISIHSYIFEDIYIIGNIFNNSKVKISRNTIVESNIFHESVNLYLDEDSGLRFLLNSIFCDISINPLLEEVIIDMTMNYWGTVDPEEIENRHDINYDGEILYSPYLNGDMNIYVEKENDDSGNISVSPLIFITVGIFVFIIIIMIVIILVKKRK